MGLQYHEALGPSVIATIGATISQKALTTADLGVHSISIKVLDFSIHVVMKFILTLTTQNFVLRPAHPKKEIMCIKKYFLEFFYAGDFLFW